MATKTVAIKKMPGRQRARLIVLLVLVLTFPITMNYFSPILSIMGSSEGVVASGLIYWTVFTLITFTLGRAMCGYACPLGAFQEVKDRVVAKPLTEKRISPWVKYALGIGWVVAIVYLGASAGGYTQINPQYLTDSGVSVDRAQGWIIWGIMAGLVLIPTFVWGRRAFCRYMCPWSSLNIAVTWIKDHLQRLPSLRLSAAQTKCTQCRLCSTNCPMNLPVTEMVNSRSMKHNECILCGTCVDHCPNGVIKYSWSRP